MKISSPTAWGLRKLTWNLSIISKDLITWSPLSQMRQNVSVLDLHWTPRSLCRDMICLIQSKTLLFLNCSTGALVWDKKYILKKDENLKQIELDPFDCSKIYLLSTNCLMKQLDFGLVPPQKSPRKIFLDDNKRSFVTYRQK